MLARHEPAFAKDDGAFNRVPELAHVAGPGVPDQVISRILRDLFFGAAVADAQELEPRAFSPLAGRDDVRAERVRTMGRGYFFDPSLDVSNVQADLWIATPGFGYTFGLAGRQARLLAVVPIAWGTVAGDVSQQPQQQDLWAG